MIRTTIRLDEDIFKEARKKAIEERKPFADIVNSALREYLKAEQKKLVRKKVEFGAYHIGAKGTLRRVDIYANV